MSDKQLGAAPEAQPESQPAPGWVGRLRAQPGFRAAAVAFFLTVILGAGGPAAYAYWSQSTAVTVTGTTAPPVTPVPTNVKCVSGAPLLIEWAAAPEADKEVRYVVTLRGMGTTAAYALPRGTRKADPYSLYSSNPGGMRPPVAGTIPVTATVRSAIVRTSLPANTAVPVTDADLVRPPSAESTPVNMSLKVANGVPSLSCA